MAGPQYTSCVEPEDFQPYKLWWLAVVIPIVGGVVTFVAIIAEASALAASLLVGWGVIAILVEFMHYTLNWMLNEKLICLTRTGTDLGQYAGSQVCAIGEVGDIELVGEDKNPIEDVDNDYCINLVLAPIDVFRHYEFALNHTDVSKNEALARDPKYGAVQGDLITEQPGMPQYGGYSRTFIWFGGDEAAHAAGMTYPGAPYEAWTEYFGHGDADAQNQAWKHVLEQDWPVGKPWKYEVPVLHTEFEGSRIRDVLAAIDAFSFGGNWCKKNWLFELACKILRALFSPAALANALRAWLQATAGSQDPALVDPAAGEARAGDMVVMTGRWVYDGGHSGYNEMHAVRLLQKVYNVPPVDFPVGGQVVSKDQVLAFERFRDEWCRLLGDVPPHWPGSHTMTGQLQGTLMTAAQQEVFEAQQRPENRWVLHPALDSCIPDEPHEQQVLEVAATTRRPWFRALRRRREATGHKLVVDELGSAGEEGGQTPPH